MAGNLPNRARCIYCWKKGVKDGLMGKSQWTTPRGLWAGQWDNSTHKERSASLRRLFVCNKNESKRCEFSFVSLKIGPQWQGFGINIKFIWAYFHMNPFFFFELIESSLAFAMVVVNLPGVFLSTMSQNCIFVGSSRHQQMLLIFACFCFFLLQS